MVMGNDAAESTHGLQHFNKSSDQDFTGFFRQIRSTPRIVRKRIRGSLI